MRRYFRAVLALLLALTLSTGAFAATSYAVKPRRINVYTGLESLRVGQKRDLSYEIIWPTTRGYLKIEEDITEEDLNNMQYTVRGEYIRNEITDATWYSEDDNIAEVDQYGEVTGIAPGEVTISLTLRGPDSRDRDITLGTGEIRLTVLPQSAADLKDYLAPEPAKAPEKSEAPDFDGGRVTSMELAKLVEDAVQPGKTATVRLRDVNGVSKTALENAAKTAAQEGGAVRLAFDTMSTLSVDARLIIDPAVDYGLTGDLKPLVHIGTDEVKRVSDKITGVYKNRIIIAKSEMAGGFGAPVGYAVKHSYSYLRGRDLSLYSYNAETGALVKIPGVEFSVDTSGYVHFTAAQGGWLVICEDALTKRVQYR